MVPVIKLNHPQRDAVALAAGAQFIVTPGMDPDLVRYCQEKGVDIFPGCTHPPRTTTRPTSSAWRS